MFTIVVGVRTVADKHDCRFARELVNEIELCFESDQCMLLKDELMAYSEAKKKVEEECG
jgi:hypothetical protein